MSYLPIKVNGRGLIPRGHGIAPKSLINADLQLIQLILNTPGLSMEHIQPDNTLIPMDRLNYQHLYDHFNKERVAKKQFQEPVVVATIEPEISNSNKTAAPEVPVVPVEPKVEETPKVEIPEEPKVEVSVEETTNEVPEEKQDFGFKPVHKENEKWNKKR